MDDADELAQVVRAAKVDASLLERFTEEALTLRLLRDMGERLSSHLEELGLSAADATHLAALICGRGSLPVSMARDGPASGASSRVAAIQQSLFADDVPPPDDADKWSDEALYAYFERGGQAADEPLSPIVVATGWRLVQPHTPQPTADADAADASALSPPPQPVGPIVGSIPLRWQGHEASFDFGAHSTVRDLKEFIRHRTDVPLVRQKLLGWAIADQKRAEQPQTLLADVGLGPRSNRIMVLGTPQAEAARAEADLERGRRAHRFIASDLRPPPPTASAVAAAAERRRRPAAHDGRPVRGNRGGGIYLDPHVWALSPEEEEERRRERGTHVLNRATNRLERLELGTALLGDGAGGGALAADPNRPPQRIEEQPVNVDLLGAVRGACLGCDRCDGYVRAARHADNENDLAVLNCARCGCACTQHREL